MIGPIVHVYAQPEAHEAAYVAGNRAGLLALREAVDEALRDGASEAHVFVNDGEGFSATVMCLHDVVADTLRLPYASLNQPEGYDSDEAFFPWDLDVDGQLMMLANGGKSGTLRPWRTRTACGSGRPRRRCTSSGA